MDRKGIRPRGGIASQIERKQKMIAEYERLASEFAGEPEKAAYFRKRADDFRDDLRTLEAKLKKKPKVR